VLLRALPIVRERIPGARLLVIGDGPYRPTLERLAADLGLADAVEFAGYVDDHEEVEQRVRRSGVGVAVYDPAIAAFSYYADPGKIRNYLASGVPVVVTDVPQSAREIASSGAGVVVSYEARAIAEGIVRVLEPESHAEHRAAARKLGERHHWPVIFDAAFASDGH
jgi:glycosyltransferase involved in cell wall biosynthesis